jgi:hypothetical protein
LLGWYSKYKVRIKVYQRFRPPLIIGKTQARDARRSVNSVFDKFFDREQLYHSLGACGRVFGRVANSIVLQGAIDTIWEAVDQGRDRTDVQRKEEKKEAKHCSQDCTQGELSSLMPLCRSCIRINTW